MKATSGRQTDRLPIGEGGWIEVKKYLTYGEKRKLQGSVVDFGLDGTVTPKAHLEESQPVFMAVTIQDWNMEDDNGRTLPINLSSIDRLDPDVADMILLALRDYYAGKLIADDEPKNES